MRLVHLAGYGGPYAGSFIPMLRAVMRAARRRGWSGELVFGPAARGRGWLQELREDEIPVRIAPTASRSELSRMVGSILAASDEPTVLHTHFTTFDVPALRAARRRSATAVFWHIHTPHGTGLGVRARNLFKYAVLGRQVDRILCVSAEVAATVRARGGPRDRLVVAPNAIDTERFACASGADREQARRSLGLDPGRPLLVHFGWDWHRKGGDVFCESVRRLADAGRDVAGVTVGGGDAARTAARELGLPPAALRVDEARDDVRVFYAAADVFVAPSRAEGTPYSVLEALSSGAPVVASRIPGHVEIGDEVGACRLVPLDPGAVAETAAAVLDRPAARAADEAAAGRAWVRHNRDLARWSEQLMERYEEALPTGR